MKIIQKFTEVEVARLELKGMRDVLHHLQRLSGLINFNVPVLKSGIQRVTCTDNSFAERPMARKTTFRFDIREFWRLSHI
jgi:hypothetical protein